ncbi:hypothetical protein [Deinococcus peraridilitoris]|uniref:hypothetical protein n=1 Tax=Deinococcus peraridilitoris TaxID=432329 RepID=UPI003CCBB8A8
MNTTVELNTAGQLAIIFLMYLGCIGLLTFAIALAMYGQRPGSSWPQRHSSVWPCRSATPPLKCSASDTRVARPRRPPSSISREQRAGVLPPPSVPSAA